MLLVSHVRVTMMVKNEKQCSSLKMTRLRNARGTMVSSSRGPYIYVNIESKMNYLLNYFADRIKNSNFGKLIRNFHICL